MKKPTAGSCPDGCCPQGSHALVDVTLKSPAIGQSQEEAEPTGEGVKQVGKEAEPSRVRHVSLFAFAVRKQSCILPCPF